MINQRMCSVEVKYVGDKIYKYRNCKYPAKYRVYWKYKLSERKDGIITICCERHKKLHEKYFEVLKVEKLIAEEKQKPTSERFGN